MALTKAKKTGGTYFEPAQHVDDLILVIEGKKILRDQPHEYKGKKSVRDVAVADIACFKTSEDVDNKEPSVIFANAQITAQILVSDLESNGWLDGGGGMVTIRRPGQAFVYRDDFTDEAEAAAVAWYEARNANRESAADDMPPLD